MYELMLGGFRSHLVRSASMRAKLTQVPIRNGIIVIHFIVIVVFLDPIALVLLGNRAGAVEARSDVLFVVWNGLVFLDVALKTITEQFVF